MKKKFYLPRAMVACLAIVLLLGTGTAAYAYDVGGIQRQVQLWINGDQTDVVLEFNGQGEYTMSYKDDDGTVYSQSGGGVAYDFWGNERPLTEEELLENLNTPDVRYDEDGRCFVSYYGQTEEITDHFDADGICYVKLVHNDEPMYMTISRGNGFACSSNRFVDY